MSRVCSERLAEKLREHGLADFDRYRVEYEFELVLVNLSPLHVGAGRESDMLGSPIDLSVAIGSIAVADGDSVRVYRGPVIPGSTLKGVLRSLAEGYAAGLGYLSLTLGECVTQGGCVCGNGGIPDEVLKARCTGEALADIEKLVAKCDNCVLDLIEKCDECFWKCFASPAVRLFGAPWLASHVTVFDAYPVDLAEPPRSIVTRVAIDRMTGSQSPGKLYTMEFVEAGTRWLARLKLYNVDLGSPRGVDERAAKLFRILLENLAEGVSVGRRTTAGHGVLKLLVDESRVTVRRIDANKGIVESRFTLSKLIDRLPKS